MFDLANIQSIWNSTLSNLSANPWVIADLGFLGYCLWSIISHFNDGITGVILKFLGYALGYFTARWCTLQITSFLGLTGQYSTLMIALVIFIASSYMIYKILRYFVPGSRSYWFINGLLGAVYGVAEVLFFVYVINAACVLAKQNNWEIPKWILVANKIVPEDGSTENMRPPILFAVTSYYGNNLPVNKEQITGWYNWVQSNFVSVVSSIVKENPAPAKEVPEAAAPAQTAPATAQKAAAAPAKA